MNVTVGVESGSGGDISVRIIRIVGDEERGDESRSHAGGAGSGLGLAIARRDPDLIGATLQHTDQGPGDLPRREGRDLRSGVTQQPLAAHR